MSPTDVAADAAAALLAELAAQDIRLSAADGRLRCDAPKGALTPAVRAAIQQHKPTLLRLLAADGEARPVAETLPLSPAQERIWLLSRLAPVDHVKGNLQLGFELRGALEPAALERALTSIVERHQVFRIRCATRGGRAVQGLADPGGPILGVRDLRGLGSAERDEALTQAARRVASAPFDLSRPPLLRCELLRLDERTHHLLLASHQYCMDGWSSAILLDELSQLYRAYRDGAPAPLPPLPIQFAEVAARQRRWLAGAEARRQADEWRERLRGAQPLRLTDRGRPTAAAAPAPALRLDFRLPDEQAAACRALVRQANTTLFIGLLAAFQALLARWTGQRALAVGTIASTRRGIDTEGLIGPFANPILITAQLPDGLRFRELLARTHATALAAYSRQELPFEHLLAGLDDPLVRVPAFRAMFVLHQHQAIAGGGLALDGLAVTRLPEVPLPSHYQVELIMVERADGIRGQLVYDSGTLRQADAEALVAAYRALLERVSADPEQPVDALPAPAAPAPEPSPSRRSDRPEAAAPRSPTEARLARLWRRLLRCDAIGIHDRFDDLGGHSLLAIQLWRALEIEFGRAIAPLDLGAMTIAELAGRVDGAAADDAAGPAQGPH